MAGSIALLVVLVVAGCGSSSSPQASATAGVCSEVAAVLSDGPDPGADPVGYAEAQILPLRRIHTSDHPLGQAIDRLASAYAAFYRADGRGAGVKRAVVAAERVVDAECPGVAP